ncbi:MAG: hypothetical protein HY400_07300, partial [Elusimicrobia bacterium]|nr:hypothetical protein [Elusimicrobiota bacterium]
DVGTVFPNPGDLRAERFHFGPGAAFRVVVRPQVVGTFDLVLGKEGPNFLIHVGYPF